MQEKQPPVCSKCGYGNPGNLCSKGGAQQPAHQSTRGPRKPTRKSTLVEVVVASIIALGLLGLLILQRQLV